MSKRQEIVCSTYVEGIAMTGVNEGKNRGNKCQKVAYCLEAIRYTLIITVNVIITGVTNNEN